MLGSLSLTSLQISSHRELKTDYLHVVPIATAPASNFQKFNFQTSDLSNNRHLKSRDKNNNK